MRVPVIVQFDILTALFPQNMEEKCLVRHSYPSAAVAFGKLFTSSDLKRSPGGSAQILNTETHFASYLWNQQHSFRLLNILLWC